MPAPPLLKAAVPQKKSAPVPQNKSMPAQAPPVAPPAAVAAQSKRPTESNVAATPQPTKPVTAAAKSNPSAAPKAANGTLAQQVSSFLTTMILELEPDDKPSVGSTKFAEAPHRQAPSPRQTRDECGAVDLESTQTMRALTTAELEDDNKMSHWFAIELSVSDRAFDPDAVPDLDIFAAYRLYVLEAPGQGRLVHTLRLGFFGEEIAAKAVADYLVDHYPKPTVMRVSIAERERFSERRVEARKKVEATGKHAVIEITDQRYVRELSVMPTR
jgi:hypothetical protein